MGKGKGIGDDLLPDTNPYRERTLAGNIALGLGFVMIVFVTTGFVSPNWLEVDPRFYGTKFHKLGLWVHCFNSFPDPNDLSYKRFFVACRWIFNPFTDGYAEIRYLIVPRKAKNPTNLFLFNAPKQNKKFISSKTYFCSVLCGDPVFLHTLLHWDVDLHRPDPDVPALY